MSGGNPPGPVMSGGAMPSPVVQGAGGSGENMEAAGRLVEQHLNEDNSYMELSGQLRIATHVQTNCSGHTDIDYPSLGSTLPSLVALPHLGSIQHVPIPPELLQEFQNMQCNCAMNLMPEIRRAWLTIDSTIYMWNYEDGKDLAYFDGLSEVILAAALVLPRAGVFQEHIQYLLCLTTAVEVVVLGVSFTASQTDPYAEMHLQPEPLFHVPSDNVSMVCVEGTPVGRLFLAGKDGCLYEITYQAEDGWFSKKCRKINHSVSMVSYLVPSFLSFSEEDALVQLVIDSTRHILYTRSENNTITVYDMGKDGYGLRRVSSISMNNIVQRSLNALRSADKGLISPLVWISVIPASESATLHLLAITKSGVRLYFTTTPGGIIARPSLLALVHVRLPPGYSPSSSAQRPGANVHQAFYRKGTLVLSSSQTEEKDNLWIMDSSLFPFQCTLMESHVITPLEGRMWAIAETIQPGELEAVSSPTPSPPTVVTQHAHPTRKFVLLTTQGSYIVTKLRPVDQLQFLLEACKGGSSEAIESFFKLYKETQACAMCLILATKSTQQVSVWATEAFFKYGGEPHFIFPATLGPSGQPLTGGASPMQTPPLSGLGNPGQYSNVPPMPQTLTPQYGPGPSAQYGPQQAPMSPSMGMGPHALGRALTGPEVHLSGKHNGLVRYLSRLLRPLWNEPIAINYKPPGDMQNEQVHSRFNTEELAVFSEQLLNLREFLERNKQLFSTTSESLSSLSPSNVHQRMLHFMRPDGMSTDSPAGVQQSLLKKYQADAHLMEYNSLLSLHRLVVRCCECLSLLKLLCEYQFDLTAAGLSKDYRLLLQQTAFRSLFINGKQLTSSLITSLLTRYAGDAGMSDTLTSRLRNSTPSLFSQDDAVMTKGLELVAMAKATQSKYDQLSHLRGSLKNFSQVTHQISLTSIAEQYSELHYFEGIVELALCSAKHKDPQNLGLHFYRSGQPQEDLIGQKAFMERQQVYSTITSTLHHLFNKDQPGPTHQVPIHPGPPSDKQLEETPDPRKEFDDMVAIALRSDDELFHVTLYSWFISVHLEEKIVEIQSPYVEEYLKYTASIQADNRLILDLLWRFYERNKNYGAAARILDQIAHREGSDLSLDERLEYISRAVMCAKSCNLATSASKAGEVLHELEEKMEVAHIQLGVLDALKLLPRSPNVTAAIGMLNEELMDITKLYGDFAEPFGLAECKLAIVHCAGHYDPTLVESLWRDVVDNELQLTLNAPPPSQMQAVRTKLSHLGPLYARSERFFPLEYLTLILEKYSCQRRWERGFVHQLFLEIGVSMTTLFTVYDKMFKAKDSFWQSVNSPLHVLGALVSVLTTYTRTPTLVPIFERPSFTALVQDAISHYLVELQTMSSATPNLTQITSKLRELQTVLQRLPSS